MPNQPPWDEWIRKATQDQSKGSAGRESAYKQREQARLNIIQPPISDITERGTKEAAAARYRYDSAMREKENTRRLGQGKQTSNVIGYGMRG